MEDILFCVLFFLTPVYAEILLRMCGLSLFRYSIESVVILAMLIFAFSGLIILYFHWDDYRYLSGVQDKRLIFQMLIYSSISILFLIIGFSVFRGMVGKVNTGYELKIRSANRMEMLFVYALLAVSFLFLIRYIQKVPKIALLVALSEGTDEAKVARSLMGNAFEGGFHWYTLFIRDMLRMVVNIFYAQWFITRTKTAKILFFTTLFISLISSIMATEKAPIIWLFMSIFFVHAILKNDGFYDIKKTMVMIVIVLGFMLPAYMFFMGVHSFDSALFAAISRAMTGGIAPAYHYLDFFPAHHDFLWGTSFPNPRGLLPFEHYRLTVELMDWLNPHLAAKGIVGSMPTVFWGEMYANFGLVGVVLAPIPVGMLISFVASRLNYFENSPVRIGFSVWFAMHYMILAESSLSGFIIDIILLVVAMIGFVIVVGGNNLKLRILKR